ncbi:MAG TPA: DUF4037 domain-containing protein [Roseiflexaceae bacterium]|nr:DUF4037 domain-containing protein [Roseiflexaceae bacterium]
MSDPVRISFMPGLELCRRFYEQVVRPLFDTHFPQLQYAAARIGAGSDVLGFDTPMSTDHDWGPAVTIFLLEQDQHLFSAIDAVLAQHLPASFLDVPVLVPRGAQAPGETRESVHRVMLTTLRRFVQAQFAHNIDQPLAPADWLTISAQKLRECTAGAAFHDATGELSTFRQGLAWYPDDVWRYLLAAGWQRIGQEEHLMSRAGFVGDEQGSALIGSRLVRDIMQLCFLIERQYPPYPKWFGSAFAQLQCQPDLAPLLDAAQFARRWPERASALGLCYEQTLHLHNQLGITPPITAHLTNFFNRPFPVIFGSTIAEAIAATIVDPEVQRIAARPLIGSIDQWSDSTDLRSDPSWRARLRSLYED